MGGQGLVTGLLLCCLLTLMAQLASPGATAVCQES